MPWVLRGRVLRCPAAAGGWRRLGAVVSGIFIQFPGAGMVPRELRLARVRRTAWDAGGVPGRCCGCCRVFFPNTAGFWVWFLPPSLPATPFRLLLLACNFTSPASWANRLASPHRNRAGGQADQVLGPPPGGGSSPPRPPVKGFGGESEHGKHVGLAPKGTEPGALGAGSQEHPHRRQGTVQPPACGARPLPPPLLPRPPRLSLFNNLECIGCKKSLKKNK